MFNSEDIHDPKHTTNILSAESHIRSATGEFPPQWNPEVQCRTQKRPPLSFIPSNMNSYHSFI
jgi:hypothetical protein